MQPLLNLFSKEELLDVLSKLLSADKSSVEIIDNILNKLKCYIVSPFSSEFFNALSEYNGFLMQNKFKLNSENMGDARYVHLYLVSKLILLLDDKMETDIRFSDLVDDILDKMPPDQEYNESKYYIDNRINELINEE